MSIKSRMIQASILAAVSACSSLFGANKVDPEYAKPILEWRQKLETTLKSDTGWLTVAGLHWLSKGETTFGSDPKNTFVLPAGKAPARAGKVRFDGKAVTLEPEANAGLQVNGKPAAKQVLIDDAKEVYDIVTLGDLSFFVIVRGDKTGLRLRDKSSKYRKAFTHRSWYDVKPEYKVSGKFFPFAQPKHLKVPTVIEGVVEEHESPGEVEFALNGKTQRVQVLKASNNQVWLIFRDQSSGKATYPAGRFLYGDKAADGTVTFDFNRAYNPPCAFTPFATCPLPPRQNYLKVAIEAGELNYHVEP